MTRTSSPVKSTPAPSRPFTGWIRAPAQRVRPETGDPREANRDPAPRSPQTTRPALPPPAESFNLDGSNAWAFHGSRTESGHTILLRNPHLRWDGDHDLLARPSGLT